MARDTELEDEITEALEAFLANGGCTGDHAAEKPGVARIRRCCVIAFIAGTGTENVYPESVDDLDSDEDEIEEEPEEPAADGS